MKVAILGAGYIGGIMAETIKGMEHKDIELYAVGAREKKRAEEFAQKYGIEKSYGSYEELVKDENIDEFIKSVGEKYTAKTGLVADFYVAKIGDGSRKLGEF